MATIHVNRGGTSVGTFSEEDVRAGLRSGRFVGTDLGWRKGMASWQPLSQFSEFAADIPTGAPPPPTTPPVTSTIAPAPIGSTSPSPEPRSGLPWEHRQQIGILKSFVDTLLMVLTKPSTAFTAMGCEGGLTDPIMYGLLGMGFGVIVKFLFILILQTLGIAIDRNNAMTNLFGMGVGIIVALVLMPLFIAIALFINAAILHVCLMIVGGAKKPFEATFRVVSFSAGSTYPLLIIPFCGGLIAGVWTVVLDCIGLARAHETDTGRAVLAVLLPLIVCCGGGLLLVTLLGGLGALSQFWNH